MSELQKGPDPPFFRERAPTNAVAPSLWALVRMRTAIGLKQFNHLRHVMKGNDVVVDVGIGRTAWQGATCEVAPSSAFAKELGRQ